MNDINNRIAALRLSMSERNIQAFIVPSSDPHQSEYVAGHWQFRQWISGFTGSAGVFFATPDYAGLSTDSRYFLQAETELKDSEVKLHRQVIPHQPQVISWLADNLEKGAKVGIDPQLFSIKQVQQYTRQLERNGLILEFCPDLINDVWTGRPPLPQDKIFEHDIKYAGLSRGEKLSRIRAKMYAEELDYHLVTTLDDIAWIFNIRGNDVESNPVAIAYALIGRTTCDLFINLDKVPENLQQEFTSENIKIKPYEAISKELAALDTETKILLDKGTVNAHLYQMIKATIIDGMTISTILKAEKNPVEAKHIRNVMIKDGVALTKLYRWLEKTLQQRSIKETEVAEKLIEFRQGQSDYYGESFSAIVGYQGNGAIVHYRAQEETCAEIKAEGILLLDSGGQYLDGTTDITRTVALSEPTAEQKRNYTLVLKGHIDLATLHFPYGTRGNQMELLARKSLWKYGLNYGHGTGHGVGFFLNVHEGPQSLSSAAAGKAAIVFEPGMLTSNEPGFYKTDEYGIRIENLILCIEDQKTDFGSFLKFETLTLFPIDTTLIDFSLLTREEVAWLNDYHKKVFEKLSPQLEKEEKAWLAEKCKEI